MTVALYFDPNWLYPPGRRGSVLVKNQLVVGLMLVGVFGAAGCASGKSNPPVADGGVDSHVDGMTGDGSIDTGVDGSVDTGVDSGPTITHGTCEACETHADCEAGSYCVSLTVGGKTCLPGCNPDIPSCPRDFNCVLGVASGVDSTVCTPVGTGCCVDDDHDTYGQGIGCEGTDCNDMDENINPGAAEICDGADNNCDGATDEPPTDCASGRCADRGDGTYEAVESASCESAMCVSGTLTDCMLFSCEDGGSNGNHCATSCDPGTGDDDLYCIATAHCDLGACTTDEPNGGTCDEDTDCTSGHCDSGYCCGSGDCCVTASECGSSTIVCDDPAMCQGTRGDSTCIDNMCGVMAGIADDSACSEGLVASDCGLYQPVQCNGMTDQTPPVCATSCTLDSQCIDSAHCDLGSCVPDRPAGGTCGRDDDCVAGLFCVDGVCCTSTCMGSCQACNVAGSLGACTPIPAGTDPAGECAGFLCNNYFTGFTSDDICRFRQDVSGDLATCNGGGACLRPSDLCPSQPAGPVQVDCDNNCQTPTAGTCAATIAGGCDNLDNPTDTVTCGTGACTNTVQHCVGGVETICSPGSAGAEICNLTIDDNCDGTIDEGFQDTANGSCAASYNLMSIASAGSSVVSPERRLYGPSDEHWYQVNYPTDGVGAPTITFAVNTGGVYKFDVKANACATVAGCGTGNANAATTYRFIDDTTSTAFRTRNVVWPGTVFVRVYRTNGGNTCGTYQLRFAR